MPVPPETTVTDFEVGRGARVCTDEDGFVDAVLVLATAAVPPETTVADLDVGVGAFVDAALVPLGPMAAWVIGTVPGTCSATTNPNRAAAPVARTAIDRDTHRTLDMASRRCRARGPSCGAGGRPSSSSGPGERLTSPCDHANLRLCRQSPVSVLSDLSTARSSRIHFGDRRGRERILMRFTTSHRLLGPERLTPCSPQGRSSDGQDDPWGLTQSVRSFLGPEVVRM